MATLSWHSWLLGVGLVMGCGDSLVDESYRGPVLFTIRGNVTGASDALPLNSPVRIALFWSPSGPATKNNDGLVEQPTASAEALIPFSFTLNLFDAAPESLYYTPPSGSTVSPYAIAQLLGYPDTNGNGQHDAGEPIVAASANRALLYTKVPLTADQSPTAQPMAVGYHLISSDIPCGPRPIAPPPAPPGATCAVPLGAACSSDAQCGPGVCLKNFMLPWPQGGCAAPDPPTAGCGPPTAARVVGTTGMGMGTGSSVYWLQSCTTDADCGRDFPYQCDLAFGACAPTLLLTMQVGDPPMIAPWCRQPNGGM